MIRTVAMLVGGPLLGGLIGIPIGVLLGRWAVAVGRRIDGGPRRRLSPRR